jgi:alpha,alpha-trehalase
MRIEKQVYDLKGLFEEVQLKDILKDGKTFTDSTPKFPLDEIENKYLAKKDLTGFDLRLFIENNFDLPAVSEVEYKSDTTLNIEDHIKLLWGFLTRETGESAGSLINLPFPYIVPGGRFREFFYWDSYFIMLGLQLHGHVEMVENMVNNFTSLIQNFGHIPNGNRTYFLSRSQPPFFALMVELLANAKNDDSIYVKYLPTLREEYDFWQLGANDNVAASLRTVMLEGGEILNRYFDEDPTPRPEGYAVDIHVSKTSGQPSGQLFTNIRAGCESGWDFSSRWFGDHLTLATIETTDIIPVDLNCLMCKLEKVLAKAYLLDGKINESQRLETIAGKRIEAIIKYCWNEKLLFFTDYNWEKKAISDHISAAGLMPLFIVEENNHFIKEKAGQIANTVTKNLLQPGGLVTTTIASGQQWDWPNGWAPLQWVAVKGLQKFGQENLAGTIAQNWVSLNEKVYAATGKIMEKYDVVDTTKLAGGGEYESQDGFGWTNGVYLALKNYLNGI